MERPSRDIAKEQSGAMQKIISPLPLIILTDREIDHLADYKNLGIG